MPHVDHARGEGYDPRGSKAHQTFVAQLAGGWGGYLPTDLAVAGGGYGAVVASGEVGQEGGRMLVDETVGLIELLWR